ncbi:hypothetical protein EDD15DRAFT_2373914 [Pisolithus albus]|nr:hypothetical protein EDD15DRAFT_2373914 [Pisolithus albus]
MYGIKLPPKATMLQYDECWGGQEEVLVHQDLGKATLSGAALMMLHFFQVSSLLLVIEHGQDVQDLVQLVIIIVSQSCHWHIAVDPLLISLISRKMFFGHLKPVMRHHQATMTISQSPSFRERMCICTQKTKLNLLPVVNVLGHVNNNAEDVVAAHQQCNYAARLPNNSQLNSIQEQQSSTLPQVPQAQSMISLPSGALQLLEAVNPPVPPVGPAIVKAELWQLHFYKPVVQDILKCTKQFSHCDAASINAFPLHPHFNIKAVEYMEEAISKRLSHGLSVSDNWWPHYMNDIGKLKSAAALGGPGQLAFIVEEEGLHICHSMLQLGPPESSQSKFWDAKDLLGDCGVFSRDGQCSIPPH